MIFYLTLGLTLYSLLQLSEDLLNNHVNKKYTASPRYLTPFFAIVFVMVILTFISGIRWMVGTDYPTYLDLYNKIDLNSVATSLKNIPQDFGFVVFQFGVKNLFPGDFSIFFAAALITLLFLFIGIRNFSVKTSDAFFVYFFMGFYVQSFNSVRQSIAVTLVFMSFSIVEKGRKISFLFFLIAFTFHASSIFAWMLIYVSRRRRFSVYTSLLIMSISFLSSIFFSLVSIDQIVSFFNPRYGGYLEGQGAGLGTQLNILFNLALLLWIVKFSKGNFPYYLVNLIVIGIATLIVALSFVTIGRLTSYFTIFYVVLIPLVLQNQKTRIKFLIFVVLLVYFGFFASKYNEVIPYQSWYF